VYGREYNGRKINFEASGGLINSSLVMQDFETDSYWAIMSGEAIAGKLKGTKLVELPVGEKMKWQDWRKKHPETVVLSINGREEGRDVYRDYFTSSRGFGNSQAQDKRLKTKEPIFAFRLGDKPYAVAYKKVKRGFTADLGDVKLFFYRPKKAGLFESTTVYASTESGFKQVDGQWLHEASGCVFNPETGTFEGNTDTCPQRFKGGFDTFWYNWSLNNPETEILR